MYIYIYTHTHTYIHIHTYADVWMYGILRGIESLPGGWHEGRVHQPATHIRRCHIHFIGPDVAYNHILLVNFESSNDRWSSPSLASKCRPPRHVRHA